MSLRGPALQALRRGPKGRVVGVGNDTGGFNLQTVFCLFETLKMFYPPEGLCKAEPEGGPIIFTYVLLLVQETILEVSIYRRLFPFLKH